MDAQERRAKALEIAVLIIGERIDKKVTVSDYGPAREVLDYDAMLTHYLPLAKDIARYIREEDEG